MLAERGRASIEDMVEAGERVLECYRLLRKGGQNIVGEVLKGEGTFYEMDHYPSGDVYDNETHSQYYYHSHREGEHGHFHTFLREAGMPDGLAPVEQSHASFMDERDDTLGHLVAISMDSARQPHRDVHHEPRWVTADTWYRAEYVVEDARALRDGPRLPVAAGQRLDRGDGQAVPAAGRGAGARARPGVAEWLRLTRGSDTFEDRGPRSPPTARSRWRRRSAASARRSPCSPGGDVRQRRRSVDAQRLRCVCRSPDAARRFRRAVCR